MLAIGFVAVLLVLAVLARLAAGPASRDPRVVTTPDTDRAPSRSMRALRGAGLAPPATIGVGLALDPRDGTGWSVRSALAGVAFGVAGLVAVVVLAASLTTLVDTPARYGTTWDSAVPGFGGDIVEQLRDPLVADDDVERLGILHTSLGLIDGEETNLHAVEALKGPVGLTMLAGRAPTGPGEVVLGSTTMRNSGAGIGSVVEIEGKEVLRATVVGRAAFPVVDERSAVGRGALLWGEDLDLVAPDDSLSHDLVIDWADGVDVDAAGCGVERGGRGGGVTAPAPLGRAQPPSGRVAAPHVGHRPRRPRPARAPPRSRGDHAQPRSRSRGAADARVPAAAAVRHHRVAGHDHRGNGRHRRRCASAWWPGGSSGAGWPAASAWSTTRRCPWGSSS